jgi:hypothetical protein
MKKAIDILQCFNLLFSVEEIFNMIIMNDFFLKLVSTGFVGLGHFNTFCEKLTLSHFKCSNCFLCHFLNVYFISRCSVCFFNIGLYFILSRRSGVFFLFLVVIYLEVPGLPLSLCSVHSRITCILFPLAFFAILFLC